jgi:hypothetical protein
LTATRRGFLLSGAGLAGGLGILLYGQFVLGDTFESFVGKKLGIDEALANDLLARARDSYGEAEYGLHAAAFALAMRFPLSALVPQGAKDHAIDGLVLQMIDTPSSQLAYAGYGAERARSSACTGLVRGS